MPQGFNRLGLRAPEPLELYARRTFLRCFVWPLVGCNVGALFYARLHPGASKTLSQENDQPHLQDKADEVATRLTYRSRLYTIWGAPMTLLLSAFAGVFCGLLLDVFMLAITPRHKHV
jgi:hypothetical protein